MLTSPPLSTSSVSSFSVNPLPLYLTFPSLSPSLITQSLELETQLATTLVFLLSLPDLLQSGCLTITLIIASLGKIKVVAGWGNTFAQTAHSKINNFL